MSRKALTAAVVAATVAWSISLSVFLAPLTAKAAVSGSLVKASLPAVYYVGQDGKRYVFPNEKTYKTWYADFSTVMTITDAELASMPIGGNVTYRPGVKLVKITTDPKTYAVSKNGTLRWVKSEALAVALYGADWNTMDTHDVPDAFFTNYTVGADINAASDYSVSGEMAAATSINVDKGLGTGAVAGSVSVSLAAGQPAGGTVPRGATGVNFVKFDVRNSSASAVTVDSITVHRTGPGATSDFANVYVYNGANRLTTGRTLNSSTNEATFSGLNLSVPAGGTAMLWIAADMSAAAGAGNVNALEVTAVMVGGASAVGTPITGPSYTLASATVGTTTIAASGTLSSVKAGGPQQKVAEFRITAPSAEDADLKSIAIFYAGTASRSDLTNLTLKQAGLTLATTPSITDKDLAVFTLSSPMYMERGAQRTFEVFADVSASARASETVGFYLDQATDLQVTGRTYGFGTQITNSWTTANTATIEAGRLTTTFNGPAAKDVPQNGKDVELFNFTMAAQSNLEIRQTDLVFTANAAANCALIDDVKIVDTATGAIVAGPVDLANNNANTTCDTGALSNDAAEFTETWNLNAGQSRTLKVTADIDSTFPNNGTVQVTLGDGADLFDSQKVRNLDNSTYLSVANGDFVPSTTIAGNTHTVKSVSLTTSAASTPVQQSYIKGTQGVELAGIALKAGDAGSVRVNTVKFTGFLDNDGDGATSAGQQGCDTGCVNSVAAVVQTLRLWNGSTQVGDTESPTTSTAAGNGGIVTFDNLNLTIPAGQTVTLKLTGNLAAGLSNLPDDVYFNIAAATDVTATDVDGATVTPTGTTAGPQMVITDAGTISLTLAPDDVESEAGNVVGGASNVVLGKYRFTAQNEELKVTKARIKVAAASAVAITSLSLYDGATLVGGPTSVNTAGEADFSSVNFVIPKDSSKTLTVKGNLNTVGSSGAASGLNAMVTLDFDDNFEARGTGAGSSTQITTVGAADVEGRAKIVRKTKLTVSNVSLPSTTLNNGTMVLARYTVSADAAGDVAMKKITFNVTKSTAVGVASSAVREVGQGSDIASASTTHAAACAAAAGTACVVSIVFDDEQTIAAGTSKTYELRSTVSAVTTSGESIQTSIANDTALVTGELDNNATATAVALGIDDYDGTAADAAYSFLWSDISAIPHNDVIATSFAADDAGASNDWTNSLYVKTLPSDAQTLTRS